MTTQETVNQSEILEATKAYKSAMDLMSQAWEKVKSYSAKEKEEKELVLCMLIVIMPIGS